MSEFVNKLYDFLAARRNTGYKYLGYSVYPVTKSDLQLIEDTADYFGFRPEYLANLINFESAGTFNPAITNSIGATGLIQFMTFTAPSLGTTTAALRKMTFAQQMVYVKKYIYNNFKAFGWIGTDGKPIKDKVSQIDLFMMIFYPAAVGKGVDYKFPAAVTKSNPNTYTPKDYFDKAVAAAPFKTLLDTKGSVKNLAEPPASLSKILGEKKNLIIAGLLVVGGVAILIGMTKLIILKLD